MRSFGLIWIRISDPRSLRSWCTKGEDESTLVTDSSSPLMYDSSDLESLILIQMTSKERALSIIFVRNQTVRTVCGLGSRFICLDHALVILLDADSSDVQYGTVDLIRILGIGLELA